MRDEGAKGSGHCRIHGPGQQSDDSPCHRLEPGLIIHKIYNGYWFFGRPTMEDLRQDLRLPAHVTIHSSALCRLLTTAAFRRRGGRIGLPGTFLRCEPHAGPDGDLPSSVAEEQ